MNQKLAMSGRLTKTFADLKSRNKKAMGLFVTNGFPEYDATQGILKIIDRSGADFIELGMPFSDPLAEGLPIQRSSERALRNGTTMADAFRVVEIFRRDSETPVLLMGYMNPVFRYGVSNFCRDAESSGVDGLILPDLPPEEAGLIEEEAAAHNLDLVYLVAPNTSDQRVTEIDDRASGFVYAVTITGLTGTDISAQATVQNYLEKLRPLVTRNPLMVGFGIKDHEDAVRLTRYTDGFIVGSALINRLETIWDDESLTDKQKTAALGSFVQELKYGELIDNESV